MNILILSLRMLKRDWRAGELKILSIALIIAVASVSSVGIFTDRIESALKLQANEIMGADLVISASHVLSESLQLDANKFELSTARTAEFPSMLIASDSNQLVSVKAVSDEYPLRGDLRISSEMFAPDEKAGSIPERGSVWLELRVFNQLGININDRIKLGDAQFVVSAVLTHEPSRAGGSLFSIAPRLLLNLDDLPQTHLIKPASRVRYRSLFAGDQHAITEFRQHIQNRLKVGERVEGIEDAQPQIRTALDRAKRFLGLAAIVSVLVAGVAIAMSARRFMSRHLDSCAIMRCLGASQQEILNIYLYQILCLGLVAGLLGCLLGYVMQFGLVAMLGSWSAIQLPPPSTLSMFLGLFVGVIILIGFALPPLLHLKQVSTLRVIRRELGVMPISSLSTYGLALLVLVGLILWQTGDIKLGAYMFAGMVAGLLILLLVATVAIRFLAHFKNYLNFNWRFWINNITRRASASIVQLMAVGLCITVLLLLTVVRDDLLSEWETSLPIDTPNRFLINIQPEQVSLVKQFFTEQGLQVPSLFPMVRARLVEIDGQRISPSYYQDAHASRLVARELNLSWASQLQPGNHVIAGKWWGEVVSASDQSVEDELSIEEGLAETLGIALGDILGFTIAGSALYAKVTSLRKLEWDTFRVNFFVIAAPGVLDEYPASYITSFYLADDQGQVLNKLIKTFPNITVIDVAAIMNQVRLIIERVSMAVEYVFLFTLLASILVMYAAIQATLDQRIHENAILKALGANNGYLLRGLVAEFTSLGILSGVVAALLASCLAFVLAEYVFDIGYTFNGWLVLLGVLYGAIGVCIAGLLGTRHTLQRPPLQILQETI